MSVPGNGQGPQESQQVPPSPVPLSWQFGTAQTSDGSNFVAAMISDPTGTKVFFFSRESAVEFFTAGLGQAQSLPTSSGLIIPHVNMPPGDLHG
jgi:hypothetical protein